MLIKIYQKHTKGHEYQISDTKHQESENNTGVQIGKHRLIRHDRNQLFLINHDTHKTKCDGDTVINVRRLRINKTHSGKRGGIRLNDKYRQEWRVYNSLNLSNLVQVSLQKTAETTKVVNLSTINIAEK